MKKYLETKGVERIKMHMQNNFNTIIKKVDANTSSINELSRYDNELERRINDVNKKIEESNLLKVMMNYIVPIGTVITNSKSSFNPNDFYPGTSWQRIKGKVIVGLDENDTDFNSSGKIGGYKSFNNSHNHKTKDCTLTIEQMPSHSHEMVSTSGKNAGLSLYPFQMLQQNSALVDVNACRSTGADKPHNHGVTEDSQSNKQTLLQPYITKYVWERTS